MDIARSNFDTLRHPLAAPRCLPGFPSFQLARFALSCLLAQIACRRGSTVEQLICNQWVAGSIPVAGTIENAGHRAILLGGLFVLWAHFAPWALFVCCLADALDRRQPQMCGTAADECRHKSIAPPPSWLSAWLPSSSLAPARRSLDIYCGFASSQ